MDDLESLKTWRPVENHAGPAGGQTPRNSYVLPVVWMMVFLLNLPFCLFFGFLATRDGARVGMITAIPLFFGLGLWACYSARKIALALIIGGIPVGLSQFFPMLHVFIGMFGLEATRVVAGVTDTPSGPNCFDFVGGFIATLVTGGLLMTLALLLGLLLRAISPGYRWGGPTEAMPIKGLKIIPADLRDF